MLSCSGISSQTRMGEVPHWWACSDWDMRRGGYFGKKGKYDGEWMQCRGFPDMTVTEESTLGDKHR